MRAVVITTRKQTLCVSATARRDTPWRWRPSRKQIDRAMADAPAVAVERRAAVIPLCRVASQRLGVGWDTTVVIKATVPHHFAYTCTRNQECTAWTYDGWFA